MPSRSTTTAAVRRSGEGRPTPVRALAVFDDGSGSGPELFVGTSGEAIIAVTNRNARWNGSRWLPLASEMDGPVAALAVFDAGQGEGPALFVGGAFQGSRAGDSHIARWQGCLDTSPPVLSCPSVLVTDRLGSPPGEIVEFTISVSDQQDPAPAVVCVPPSGSFFPRGTTLVSCTATDISGNQSTCEFPVTVRAKTRSR